MCDASQCLHIHVQLQSGRLLVSENLPLLSSFLPQTISSNCPSCTFTNKVNIFQHTLQTDLRLIFGWSLVAMANTVGLSHLPDSSASLNEIMRLLEKGLFFACYSISFWLVICCIPCLLLSSLTCNLYMVRASVHAGDPAELCDTGYVSSLWGHRLQIREVQDPGGKTLTFHAHLV